MAAILVCARPPLQSALVTAVQGPQLEAKGASVSDIEQVLEARVAAVTRDNSSAKNAMESGPSRPPFLLVIQHVEREELRWLSGGRSRFAGRHQQRQVQARAHEDWSSHPLAFRALEEVAKDDRLCDLGLLAALAAYSVPIVFVGTFDLPSGEKARTVDDLDLFFLDSSIWHRYVNVAHLNGVGALRRRVGEAQERFERGTYSLSVAVEFLDYSVRAMRHLFVVRGPDDGRHGDFVALHGFHSETEKANAESMASRSAWWKARCVLIDDYAEKGLRSVYRGEAGPSKKQVVCEALGLEGSRGKLLDLDRIETCETLEEGCQRLGLSTRKIASEKPVDFVLLDYLIDGRGPDRAKGTDLLKKLAELESVAPGATILGRYWILPVSSFPSVFEAELRRGKTSSVERSYFLAPGADPVCTPELFRFRVWDLLRVMEQHANLGVEAFQGPISWAADFVDGQSDPARRQAETWLMALHSMLSRRRESFDQVESDAKSGSIFAGALCARNNGRIREVADALDILLEVLHFALWGESLSHLEALDRLDLVSATIDRIVDSRSREAEYELQNAKLMAKDWSRLKHHLETAILASTGNR